VSVFDILSHGPMVLTKVLVASTDATNCSIDDSTCNLCVTLKKGQHPNNNIAEMATKVVALRWLLLFMVCLVFDTHNTNGSSFFRGLVILPR
jgi:hypothetical protein